jgi:hypothetical protein
MRIPLERDLLDAWERGRAAAPSARALLLLQAAWPEHSADELAQLTLGRRNELLLTLRERCLGAAIVGIARCPRCGDAVEVGFEHAQMGVDAAVDTLPLDAPTHELQFGNYIARFRLPNSADLRGLGDAVDEITLGRRLVERCMIEVRRGTTRCAPRTWPDELVEAVADRMGELDPHADITLAVQCASCAHEWQQALDVGEFLYSEFSARARRLLDEIVRLAAAFGWSEREILALPPARRQSYLERLEA